MCDLRTLWGMGTKARNEEAAERDCEGGVWLCVNEQTNSYCWPRFLYPSADDAIIAGTELDSGPHWTECEPLDLSRVRLVWATSDHDPHQGWWTIHESPVRGAVECWELTW